MKFISFFVLFFMTISCVIAQHPYESALNPLKDVLPPSPTAAGLGTYGEIPVSLHTGIPNVSIPLTALSTGTLSVPISLSYHGGGNQVDAVSSWVGLGWSLNAGGVISRTVHGIPDDEQFGYWNHGVPEDFLSTGVTNPATAQEASAANAYLNHLKGTEEGKRDGQPDQFNFNINGYSGRFYIEHTGDATNPLVARLIPHQNIKIELNKPGSTLKGFTLTTPDGVKYIFGGFDRFNTECIETSKTNASGHNCGRNYSLPVITSWYLREIEAPNGIDQISFVYGKHQLTYEAGVSRTVATVIDQYQTGSAPTPCPSGIQSSYCVRDLKVEGIHLKRIDAYTGGVIEFINTNAREDLTTGGVRLTEIRQYGLKGASNYIRKYVFNQDYSLSNNANALSYRHKRLRLLSVQELGANNDNTKPPHILEYESTPLPPRLSKAKDFWGYYNGKNNASLIPASLPTNANFYQGGGDRYPDFTYAKAGVLQKITYPTGGHILLEYEGHELGYETPIPELVVGSAGMSALYYQQATTNTYTSTFTLAQEQDVNVTIDVINKCGTAPHAVSYLKIQEKINGVWQPLTVPNPNISPPITGYTGPINTGPGTIDFGVHPTVEITQVTPYTKTFDLTLPAGEYQLTAAALNGAISPLCDYDDELSIFVRYDEPTGNFIENESVGGLRVKRTTIHDGLDASKNIIKEYDYNVASNSTKSSGVGMRPTKFQTKNTTYDFSGMNSVSPQTGWLINQCEQFTTIKYSESQLPLNGVSGAHIAYKEVTVLDGINGANGKVWNKFKVVKNSEAYLYEDLRVPTTILDWQGGVLLEQVVYKKEQGNFVKLQETINDYEIASIEGDNSIHTFYGMKVGRIANLSTKTLNNSGAYTLCDLYNSNPNNNPGIGYISGQTTIAAVADFFAFLAASPIPFSTYVYQIANYVPTNYIPHPCESHSAGDYLINYPSFAEYIYVRYPIFSGWNKLVKTTTRQYDEDGLDYIETITENEYDNIYTHVKATKTTNSDGTIYTTKLKYPTDYETYLYQGDADAIAINTLRDQNRHNLAIESTKYLQKVGETEKLLGGMFTRFETNINGLVVPKAIYRTELASPMDKNLFAETEVDPANGFSYDQNIYTEYGNYTDHNELGKPLGFQKVGDIVNSYVWDYEDRVPTLSATNAHHSEIGYTSFEKGDETGWTINTTSPAVSGKIGNWAMQTTEQFPFGRVFEVDGQNKKYKFSAWVKTSDATYSYLVLRTCAAPNDATFPNANVAPSYVQTGFTTTNGAWQLVEVEIDLEAIRQAANLSSNQTLAIHAYVWNPYQKTIALDAARFHPSDAFVQTYDYDENILQPIAMEGVNRLHSSYYYDDFQRLSHVKDFEGNILAANEYHYKGAGNIENYVKTQALRIEGKTTLADLVGLPLDQLTESYQYMDGLGRPIQSVGKGQSPNQKDVVSFNEYDVYGRENKVYLPFVHSSNNTGSFKNNPITLAQNFYSNEIADESQSAYAFSETLFEASPMNRPKEQSSPGDGWQLGNNHTIRSAYGQNGVNEVLKLDGQTAAVQYYSAKSLTKSEITNTKGVKSISYTDKLGRVILVQQQVSANVWTNTYSLYNDFGNIQTIITPLAVERMHQLGNYDYTNTAFEELIYSYTYDARQRLKSKKIPNAGVVYYVYDKLDRVVATQDANQRLQGQWMIQKYDQYGRSILSALYYTSLDRSFLQDYYNQQTTFFEALTNNALGYTNTVPVLTSNDLIQNINYYDDYDFDNDGQIDIDNTFLVDGGYSANYFERTFGQATGNKVRLLDASNRFLKQVSFYDERGRVIQTQNENHLNGQDVTFSAYDFVGNLMKMKYQHTTQNHTVTNEIITEEFFDYDHTGRLLSVYHKIGNQDKILLSQQNYDELGRLIEKNLHSTNGGGNFLQSIDYHYNVRNWLVRINDLYQVSPASTNPAPSSVAVLQKQINEIVLKYNSQDVANGEVQTEIEIDDETVDLVNGIVVASQQNQEEVDLYGEGYTTTTKDEEVRVDFSDRTIDESNIGASLEELEARLQQKLTDNGLTDPVVMEVLLEDLKAEYRDRWLLLRSNVENEDNEDLFSMNFDYDYGGNIHHLEWKVASYDYRSIYDYNYDNLDRLSNANYKEYLESSTPSLPVYQRQDDFSVNNINYDIMGNITHLERRGTVAVLGTSLTNGLMDNLSYTYNGNQLTAVQDAAHATTGFVDGASTSQEYTYDANGNVTKDDNKHILISYNHLNLPKTITFSQANASIDWLYTAAGQKVQKTITDPSNVVINKHYIGNVQYINTEVDFIQHQEGRIIRNLVGTDVSNNPIYDYRYEYSLKDHLGNGRVFFSDMDKNGIVEVAQNGNANELLQQEHYYPFGMGIKGEWKFVQPQIGGTNAYQYNGKELNEDYGLNWNDYGARWYDASIARWNGIDPLAESYSSWSGYNYVLGNPVKSIDPDGKRVIINYTESVTKKNGKVVTKPRKYVYKPGKEYMGNNLAVKETVEALNYILEKKLDYVLEEGEGVVEKIANDKGTRVDINIKEDIGKAPTYGKYAKIIAFNPRVGIKAVDNDGKETGALISPMGALLHEFGHAYRYNYKKEEAQTDYLTPDVEYTNKDEKWVILKVDNEAALREGNKSGVRYNHGGIPYETKGVFSTEEVLPRP